MKRRVRVEVTDNFERNLDELERFLSGHDAPAGFPSLLDDLFDVVIRNLERFPEIGIDFLARRPASVQGAARVDRLRSRLGSATSLREYIAHDYLILYAVRDDRLWLLAIRHHRQLSYDLKGHWMV